MNEDAAAHPVAPCVVVVVAVVVHFSFVCASGVVVSSSGLCVHRETTFPV